MNFNVSVMLSTFFVCARATIIVPGHQYQWLTGGYDLEIGHF